MSRTEPQFRTLVAMLQEHFLAGPHVLSFSQQGLL
jgi:hypothetical protein